MGVQLTQGDFMRCFGHFNMDRKRKGGCIFNGIGNDGKLRTCKMDFHSSGTPVADGTAEKMAKDLGFRNARELKEYMDRNL